MERLGRYELIRRIAMGGMAELYVARDLGIAGFQRPVAVKRLHPVLARDEGFVGLLLDEARLAARLVHPGIVHIYDLGYEGGAYFIAMELVLGCDLASLLDAMGGPMPIAEALHVATEVLAALHHAHSLVGEDGAPLEVVHRDVSPRNVLLSLDGAVKLADFGIAKARTKVSVTVPGQVLGTLCSMAPEQALGEPVDRRADVYSTGVLLYRMVTGAEPFCDEDGDVLDRVRDGVYLPPGEVAPWLPERLASIVLRAMAADPAHRYPTASAMRRDLLELAATLGAPADSETLVALMHARLPALEATVRAWLVGEGEDPAPIWDATTLILGDDRTDPPTKVEGRRRPPPPPEPSFCLDEGEAADCEPVDPAATGISFAPTLPADVLDELGPAPARPHPGAGQGGWGSGGRT